MIRFIVVATLAAVLMLVLALPATRPPKHFLDVLKAEHAATGQVWGQDTADRILQRALALQAGAGSVAPVPSAADAPAAQPIGAGATRRNAADTAAAREMAAVSDRLFNNPYFRSVEALMLLAAFRLCTLLQWLPWLAFFGAAALVDGLTVRRIRAVELRPHDPERFAVFGGTAIVVICLSVMTAALPMVLPPLAAPWVPVAVFVLVSLAAGDFHRRGGG